MQVYLHFYFNVEQKDGWQSVVWYWQFPTLSLIGKSLQPEIWDGGKVTQLIKNMSHMTQSSNLI